MKSSLKERLLLKELYQILTNKLWNSLKIIKIKSNKENYQRIFAFNKSNIVLRASFCTILQNIHLLLSTSWIFLWALKLKFCSWSPFQSPLPLLYHIRLQLVSCSFLSFMLFLFPSREISFQEHQWWPTPLPILESGAHHFCFSLQILPLSPINFFLTSFSLYFENFKPSDKLEK